MTGPKKTATSSSSRTPGRTPSPSARSPVRNASPSTRSPGRTAPQEDKLKEAKAEYAEFQKWLQQGKPRFTIAMIKKMDERLHKLAKDEELVSDSINNKPPMNLPTFARDDKSGVSINYYRQSDHERAFNKVCRMLRDGIPASPVEIWQTMFLGHFPLVQKVPTLPESKKALSEAKSTWDNMSERSSLWTTIKAAGPPTVTKIVALALGPMCEEGSGKWSYVQHALLLSLAEMIKGTGSSKPLKVMAQDPMYTSTDVALLKEHGVEVAQGQSGITSIDDSSMVLSVRADFCAKQVVADIAKPAVVIWQKDITFSNVHHTDGQLLGEGIDSESQRVLDFYKSYRKFTFPALKGPDAYFERLAELEIYVRKPEEQPAKKEPAAATKGKVTTAPAKSVKGKETGTGSKDTGKKKK